MIFLLDWGGKQLAKDFIMCLILCCPILVFEYLGITCWSGNYRQVQRTGFFHDVMSVLQPLFKQFHGISQASVRRPHLLRRAACWISQPSLSRFSRIFFEFHHLAPICRLENDISVLMRQSIPAVPIPPPRANPRALAFFFLNKWANSPGWGHISCLNAPGWGRRKRANALPQESSPSNTSAFFFINQ